MRNIKAVFRNRDHRKNFIEMFDGSLLTEGEINIILSFINDTLKKRMYLEDIFELSIQLKYVTANHLKIAKEILTTRSSYYLKLTVLDFLLINVEQIEESTFSTINTAALNNTNLLVFFQAQLNLVCIDSAKRKFFTESKNFPSSTFYYRFLNSLYYSEQLQKLFKEYLPVFEANIKAASDINEEQKKDLENMILGMY